MRMGYYATDNTSLPETILTVCVVAFFTFMIFAIVYGTIRSRVKKKEKQQTDRYEKEIHVKQVTLTDPMFFGTIEAEYDDRTGMLRAEKANLPQFGSGNPSQIIVDDYREQDRDEILRILNRAYDRTDEILTKMAEMLLREIQCDKTEGIPEIDELKKLIRVTDFQFTSGEELMTLLINAGAGYDSNGYSVTALYRTNPSHWEYDAEKLDGGI